MAPIDFLRPTMVAQVFPGSSANFTEKDLGDLAGKVYMVTGANAGVGKELARILYEKNATVYMACRSEQKCQKAIDEIKASATAATATGSLHYIHVDLGDLASVKPAVQAFLARESSLHALFNNAGVMLPPASQPTTKQGYDMQLGTNCIAPFLLTQLLTPVLKATAASSQGQSQDKTPTRVVWVASMAAELYSQKYGIDMDNIRGKTYVKALLDNPIALYGSSKAGNYLHSTEYARRHRDDNIISVAVNPGNLDSDLYRTVGGAGQDEAQQAQAGPAIGFVQKATLTVLRWAFLYPSVYGAYTELFAGLSPDVTIDKSGSWIGPWGRFVSIRKDIAYNAKPVSEGGRGGAEAFWDWTMEQIQPFL